MDAAPLDAPDAPVIAGLIDATTRAAAAVVPLVGSGDAMAVDGAAVAALRAALATVPCDGRVVAGEGEKDDAPMLAVLERFGAGGAGAPAIDLAVDPVDGTRLAAAGRAGAMAVASIAPRGAFAELGAAHYLEKLVTWHPGGAIDRPLGELVRAIAEARGVPAGLVRVAVQDRPRNAAYALAAAEAGADVVLFEHGDVERSLRAAQRGTDLDLVVGIGGAPEGVLVAAAVRALGGAMTARLAPQSAAERERLGATGLDLDRVFRLDDLCAGPAACVVSAVTALDLGSVRLAAAAATSAPTPATAGVGIAVETWLVTSDGRIHRDGRVVAPS